MTPRHKKTSPPPRKNPAIDNLQSKNDRLTVFSLQTLLTNKKNPATREAARLGDVLLPWFEKTVSRPSEKLAGITDLWHIHIPPNLLPHCRFVSFNKGTLTVALDSSTARAQLDTSLRSGLLRKLQTESRGTLYRVKTCVQPVPTS